MLTLHIRESLQVTPGPFPDFWVGPGDEATAVHAGRLTDQRPSGLNKGWSQTRVYN